MLTKGDGHIGRYLYLKCASEFSDAVNDLRITNTSGVITFEKCTVANATKGAGTWVKIQFDNRFNGCTVFPTITDNGNGTVTVANNGVYNLSINVEGSGIIEQYLINGGVYSLTDLTTNYIVANYNSGTPTIQVITDVDLINETTIIPVYTVFRNGNYLHYQNWDTLGLALANKVHQSIVKTQRYRRQSGLILTESGTRNLNLTAGIIWTGGVKNDLTAIASATDNIFCWYHSGGVWTQSIVTQYNNLNYDNGTNLVELTAQRYAVNWIFRGVETQKHLYCLVGSGDYTLAQAQLATQPTPPPAISSHAVLVAKIIVQKSSNTALSITSAFETNFGVGAATDHASLTNLGWSASGHTGTASKLAGFDASGNAIYYDVPSSGGTSLWTTITGTRASNTTITVVGDQTAIFKKGMIVRWLESSVIKWGMVSIPSTYSSPNTTITIIGCVCASIDTDSFKYSSIIGVEQFIERFALAGTIGATGTNVMRAYYATEPMYVIGADLQAGTAGTTNSTTIDINKNGTTMFTAKPSLATTVAASTTPFTADTATSLALNDKVTIDIDAIQTTAAIDLYVQLYVVPQRYFTLT